MSNTSTRYSDFSEFESQFRSVPSAEETHARRRLVGWSLALTVSLAAWGAIIAGILSTLQAASH